MPLTREIIEKYQELPIAAVVSNTPYGVGKDSEEAAIRRKVRDDFINGSDTAPGQFDMPIDTWSENPYAVPYAFELKNAGYPDINFPLLNSEQLKEGERALLHLLDQVIEDDETDEVTKSIAYEQIATKLAEVYRHLEVIRGLGQTGAKQELSRERAGDMTLEIFGGPEMAVFNLYLAHERAVALEAFDSNDQLLSSIAREYLALTGDVEVGQEEINSIELSDETMAILIEDLTALFPGFAEFHAQEIEHEIGPEESLIYFNQALELVGLAAKGWTSELSNGSAAEIDENDKKIYIGRNRAPYAPDGMKGVAFHEALHALRAQNASEQEDPIKRRALAGNILVEEGIMTCIEQAINGKRRVAGLPFYMSLGLQLGLDQPDESKRDFRETHEVMWRRSLLQKSSEHGMISEQDIRNAKNAAYQTVIRTKRGNSLDARDIAYFEGGRQATEWFNEIAKLPQEERLRKLQWMLSGKFNIINPTQAAFFEEPANQREAKKV